MSQHQLSDKNFVAKTATCSICGPVKLRSKGVGKYICSKKAKKSDRSDKSRRAYRVFFKVKDSCERCQFVAEESCQLEIHHIDGNHRNNERCNLMLVCANCHRLLHYLANQVT